MVFAIHRSDVHKWSTNNARFIENREIKMPGIWPPQWKTCWDRSDCLIQLSFVAHVPEFRFPTPPCYCAFTLLWQSCANISWLQSTEKQQQQQKSTPDSSGRFQHETVIAFLRRLRHFLGDSLRMLIEIKFLSVRESFCPYSNAWLCGQWSRFRDRREMTVKSSTCPVTI